MELTTRRDPESVDMQLLLAVLMWVSARELSPTENSLTIPSVLPRMVHSAIFNV